MAIKQLNNAYIIHFAAGRKPWTEPTLPHADKFWKYARKTPFYEAILFGPEAKKKREEAEKSQKTEETVKQFSKPQQGIPPQQGRPQGRPPQGGGRR